MTILHVCSVRDRAIDAFGQPFCVTAVGSAIRSFTDEVNNPKSDLVAKHPDDFDLYLLGTFNDESAKFDLLDSPRQIAVGKDLKLPVTNS